MPTQTAIDRKALVSRHRIQSTNPTSILPIGNGEMVFTADGTGLQTFAGNTLSHWGWHSFPLPTGCKPSDVPATGTIDKGRLTGGMKQAAAKPELHQWMFDNPHCLNLMNIRLVQGDSSPVSPDDITNCQRSLDLYKGLLESSYEFDGFPVKLRTCVHPDMDAVAVHINSPALRLSKLQVCIEFPYPSISDTPIIGDWTKTDAHRTMVLKQDAHQLRLAREIDETSYELHLLCEHGRMSLGSRPHSVMIQADGSSEMVFTVWLTPHHNARPAPGYAACENACRRHWKEFWSTGGAIEFAGSTDPRAQELERRVVLSQYLTAVNSAGSYPPAESGLMSIDPWRGQWHMEMTWWHIAHYSLWGRWHMADTALSCYQRDLPLAKQLAHQFDYDGAKWGKMMGPEGRTAPWVGSFVLQWQQPHPIFFAELEYRLKPTAETLKKWDTIVIGSANYLADFPAHKNGSDRLSLNPIMPPSEQGITSDTVFDLAYWRFGLITASKWCQRMGISVPGKWQVVLDKLAPLPTHDGLYVHSPEWADQTYNKRAFEHPDPVGVFGMLPELPGVDFATAHRTVKAIDVKWDWNNCWGWDCPWFAMAAARVGEPQMAVDALLRDSARNQFNEFGVNTGGPCLYLPGNGGLLYAVAMMAAGWDGAPSTHAPGFPADGSWTVRFENIVKAL